MSRISPLAAYGARIKELYIELDHYAFFHGPSEVDRIDRRFTGRQEVLDRLTSLLTDHESPAGAYLVTGFRGAGKSSLVAKALSEITRESWGAIGARRALRIISPVLFSALIPVSWWTGWIVSVPLVLGLVAIVALGGLVFTDPDQCDRMPPSRRRIWRERWQAGLRAMFLRRELPRASRFRTLVRDILAILVLVLISKALLGWIGWLDTAFTPQSTIHRLLATSLVIGVWVGLGPIVIATRSYRHGERRRRFWKKLRKTLTASGRVHVKINLSQDNLREIDILRSIASSLESEYRRFARPTFWRLFIRCLLLLPFLLIAAYIYTTTLDHWAQDVKDDLHISCLFPSQGAYAPDEHTANAKIYRQVLRTHRNDRRYGSLDLRRQLDQKLREARQSRGASQTHGLLHEAGDNLLGPLYEAVFLVTTEIDTLVQLVAATIYRDFARLGEGIFPEASRRPFVVDYGLLIFLALGWLIPVRLMRWSLLDRPSHRDIVRQLQELNEMIDSEVTHEQGGVPFQATSFISLSFGRRQRQRYRHLNEREIEKRLIEILHHSQRISPLEIRPELIVVFDELDKIQHTPVPQAVAGLSESDDDDSTEARAPDPGPVDVIERNRQHRILSLVSNLKHFLSTAPAKFIFIAGREMFDAALADVSDRHFFMGSVFNEVLHVPSFHSDDTDDRLPDITSLPEEVLCRFLLPDGYAQRPSLAEFRQYLQDELLPDGSAPEWLVTQQRDKVMYELHNFVTYLTYRSNGAPKRVTATLERFIVKLPERFTGRGPKERRATGDAYDPHDLVVGRSSRSLYLRFRYPDQYTFGLVTYLASPLIFSVNRAIKDYGDKILVSSAFVLDHIFKFHGHGFSWRNLELLPDVVDINRAPQLRELISHIMRFLSRGHVNEIINGLYHFKFNRRISEEINFLSKLSEHESAAFNFTLDESLNLKRRFYRQLHRLLETHQRYPESWTPNHDFVNSIAFLRMILGDLHYYDGEYDSAIVEYMEAVQQLRKVPLSERADTLVLMIRNFLKLGLTFERKKTFDSALVTYGRIATIIAEFGQEFIHADARKRAAQAKSTGDTATTGARSFDLDPVTIEGIRLIYQPMFARLQMIEKATLGGISFSDIEHAEEEFQSILAASQRQERFLATAEFHNKVGDILFFKNGPMPAARKVYCQTLTRPSAGPSTSLAEIVRESIDPWLGRSARGASRATSELTSAPSGQLTFENPARDRLMRSRRRLPCQACASYNSALRVLCKDYLEIPQSQLTKPGSALIAILDGYEQQSTAKVSARRFSDRKNFLYELGDVLSDLGDTYVSCSYLDKQTIRSVDLIPNQALHALVEVLEEDRQGKKQPSASMRSLVQQMRGFARSRSATVKILEAAACFATAAVLFRTAAHHRASSVQMVKILWLLREYQAIVRPSASDWQPATIRSLVRLSIRELHRSHEGTHRLEIERIKEVLDKTLDGRSRDEVQVDLARISINANITEVLVLQREIVMLLPKATGPYALDDYDLCSPHSMFPSVYSRIHALRLRSSIHRQNLRQVGLVQALEGFKESRSELDSATPPNLVAAKVEAIDQAIDNLRQVADKIVPKTADPDAPRHELLEMILVDAAYCNHEIIRVMRIYGRSYMASHSMKAAAHDALCHWCNDIFAYIRYRHARQQEAEERKRELAAFQDAMEHAIGRADMVHISPNYHREMALLHWRAASETHTEGRAYKELLEDMFYLNDDFSDFLEHFCAALERLRINSGSIDDAIQRTTHELAKTSIYEPEHYFERRATIHQPTVMP